MARRDINCIFEQELPVEVSMKSFHAEIRNIAIMIYEFANCIQIKIRDTNRFTFNFVTKIDCGVFEQMKRQQLLDINFGDFKSQILEMLHQTQRQEMYIKCEAEDLKSKLIFYGKSKIKNLIFLVIDLSLTDQHEIFEEMNGTILNLQETNAVLQNQLRSSKIMQQEYDENIKSLTAYNKRLLAEAVKQVRKLEQVMPNIVMKYHQKIGKELNILDTKLVKLKKDLMIVKNESMLKSASSARLLQSMEALRLESIENSRLIGDLRKENSNLHSTKRSYDSLVSDLRQSLSEKEKLVGDLQKEVEVLKKDLQDATVIIAQKNKTNDELAKDLVHANQILVNFNNHYDMKVREIDELQHTLNSKTAMIKDQGVRLGELLKEFQEYKSTYNAMNEQRLSQELFAAKRQIEDLEKQNREASKLNGLLTKKLSAGSMINFEKM